MAFHNTDYKPLLYQLSSVEMFVMLTMIAVLDWPSIVVLFHTLQLVRGDF